MTVTDTAAPTAENTQPSLLDQLLESERVLHETGYYAGLENLTLRDSDPLAYIEHHSG